MAGAHGTPHSVARRLQVALGLNAVIVVAQIVAGLAAASLGLLSDAAHNLTDVAGLALALVAVRLTRRPATAERSFGWHRGTILAAQANAAMILALTVWITIEGVRRLVSPPDVDGPLVIAAAGVAFVVNTVAALVVGGHPHDHGHDRHGAHDRDDQDHGTRRDLNLHAAMLHLVADAAASAGVVLSGVVITVRGGWQWLDPAISLVIGASIGVHAWRLLRSSNAVLLEGVPDGLDVADLCAAMEDVPGVEAVHDLHVWAIASHFTALSAHVVVATGSSLQEAQLVAGDLRLLLAQRYGIEHSTLELEEEVCTPDGHGCDPPAPAAAVLQPHERH
jgi:cobalt-zinc-cadmium efflux system protein